jgi:hypothetical protein
VHKKFFSGPVKRNSYDGNIKKWIRFLVALLYFDPNGYFMIFKFTKIRDIYFQDSFDMSLNLCQIKVNKTQCIGLRKNMSL